MKIFITGGTTGIGLTLANLYLEEGHEVAVCGRDLKKIPSDLVKKFKERLHCFELDVKEQEKLANAIFKFGETGLDIVIANAGISVGPKGKEVDFEMARNVFDINIGGMLNTFGPALEIMKRQKRGQLVAIGSVAGFLGLPGASAYSASKAAVFRFCEALAISLARDGIVVTTIAPGFIDTPLTRKNNHPMPFIMSVEKGAGLIKGAIDSRKILYIFPLRMKLVIYILEKMPRVIYRLIMRLNAFDTAV